MARSNDLEYLISGLTVTPPTGSPLLSNTYGFGDNLNLKTISNATDASTSQTLGYDDAQRLLSATGAYGSMSWSYDKVGNRLTDSRTYGGTTTNSSYTYPATSNLLTNVKQGTTTTRAFTYDAAGNTTQDTRGSTAYNYTVSAAGRISQLKIGTTVTANYTYDGKDRLSVRQTLNMTPAGTTQYLYDQWDHLVAETNGSGTVVKQYVWVGDMPVAVLDGTSTPATPSVLYVHADHLNRPFMMTNAGGVVWYAQFDPFGALSTITGSVSNNGRFPGQWFQLEAGLNYNWHRHYDPSLGRYTTPDPLGLSQAPYLSVPYAVSTATLPISGISTDQDLLIAHDVTGASARATSMTERDGRSLFSYAAASPLTHVDSKGLLSGPYTPIPPGTLPTQQCFANDNTCSLTFGGPLIVDGEYLTNCHYLCATRKSRTYLLRIEGLPYRGYSLTVSTISSM